MAKLKRSEHRPRRFKRRRAKKRMMGFTRGPSQNTIYRYKRTVTYPAITATDAVVSAGQAFALSDLPDYTEFTNLYDQYRITRIIIRMIPVASTQYNAAPQVYCTPTIHHVIDYDDANAPTSLAILQEYQNYRRQSMVKPFKRSFIPCIGQIIYYNLAGSGYSSRARTWLDCAYNAIPHYGFKYWIDAQTVLGLGIFTYQYEATFYISCKNVR